ncbi:phosphoribosylglycinamide formyltransferase [Nitrospina gracilis]|uniref:phosphoribosylglycinamide formyltransferase n=1 Tax=Nitrospina gracilis TaxID=35801 RepID=UPI001F00E503|nr:phosphoribosylglycinamide formyltransferase [Nitrospina gracilis]MCF8720246.1 phosphoribosylglycinamide formyltransferase-1 [Nitrospina gracilis Nb-211]
MSPNAFKLGVLASGRGTNLQAIIDHIESGRLIAEIAIILSDKPDAQALERGRKHGIETQFVDPKAFAGKQAYNAELVRILQSKAVDLVCLAGYMRIVREPFFETFPNRIINIHPSLLPAFPGLDVQQKAIDYGVKFSGCTVHYVNEEVDGGPIILQAVVPVEDGDTAETLSARILEQEHVIYPKAIQQIVDNQLRIENRRVVHAKSPERQS